MIDVTKEIMSIANKISKAGLIDVTTDRQRKNGTQMYRDPQTNAYYCVYSSGYVRRVYKYASEKYPWSMPYPVNKRKIEKVKTLKGYEYEIKTYVLVPNFPDRIELMFEAVETYRLGHRIDILRKKFPELSNRCLRELAKKNYAYFSK